MSLTVEAFREPVPTELNPPAKESVGWFRESRFGATCAAGGLALLLAACAGKKPVAPIPAFGWSKDPEVAAGAQLGGAEPFDVNKDTVLVLAAPPQAEVDAGHGWRGGSWGLYDCVEGYVQRNPGGPFVQVGLAREVELREEMPYGPADFSDVYIVFTFDSTRTAPDERGVQADTIDGPATVTCPGGRDGMPVVTR